jgi:protein required for attachment to host cells
MLRKITPKTWVLVADGAQAKVFVGDKIGTGLQEVPIERFDGTRARSRELVTDKPGRLQSDASAGGQRSATEPRTDPHRHAEAMFIKHVAEHVESAVKSGEVNQLVLVAAPRALGDLRNELSDYVRQRVVAEIDRELVNEPAETIRDYVIEAMRAA